LEKFGFFIYPEDRGSVSFQNVRLSVNYMAEKYHPGLTYCLHIQDNWKVIFIFLLCTESAEELG
jgi:hypothetical protein